MVRGQPKLVPPTGAPRSRDVEGGGPVPEHGHDHHGPGGAEHDCDEVLRHLDDFLEGELDLHRRRELAETLAVCGHCLEAIEFEVELKLAVRESCHHDPLPPGMLDRLRDRLRGESAGGR